MAGLASMFLGQDNPVSQWIEPRRSSLLGLGGDMLSGFQNGTAGLQRGAMVDDANATRAKEEAERAASINQTAAWARSQFPELANAPDELVAQMAPQLWQQQFMGGDASDPTGFQPIPGTIGGQPAYIQADKAGNVRQLELPEGFTPQSRYDKRDLGTHIRVTDTVTGQTWDEPKENYNAAYDTAAGGAQAKVDVENSTAADSLGSKMGGLREVVGELSKLSEKATYTLAGQAWDEVMRQTGQEPSEAALARTKYTAIVDNQILPLLRDTFGAAFTVKEGETLRATLGDPNKSPKEKQAVLEAFIAQKERDLAAMQSRIPGGSRPSGQTSTGLTWSIEQ